MKYVFRKKLYVLGAAVLDAVGYILIWPFQKKRTGRSASPKHVLIVRFDHLGDVLAASALPGIVKENWPSCRVTFLTSGPGAVLLENNPCVDEVLVYDAPWFKRKKNEASSMDRAPGGAFFRLVRQIRQKRFDLAFSLRGDLRENFLLWLARIPELVGYGITGGGFFLNRELAYHRGVHEREHSLDLFRSVGLRCGGQMPRVYFSESEKKFPDKLEQKGLTASDKLMGIQLEAGTEAKEWPVDEMQAFVALLAQTSTAAKIVFVGSESERFTWLRLMIEKNPQFVDLIGQTSLRELVSITRHFHLFVGPDSGPSHIAASLGIPTLFLYSGTNVFEEWKPLFGSASCLRHEVPCSPCRLARCNVPGHPCMSGIKPATVVRLIQEKSL